MIEVQGLKCDKEGCGYIDMSIPLSEYKDNINKECPLCSSVLLTQQDYDAVQLMVSLDKAIEQELVVLPDNLSTQEELFTWMKETNVVDKLNKVKDNKPNNVVDRTKEFITEALNNTKEIK